MSVEFVVYDTNTGQIKRVGSAADGQMSLQPSPKSGRAEGVLAGVADQRKHYVDLNTFQIVDRPAMLAALDVDTVVADGVAAATLSGLPMPATVRVRGPIRARQIIPDGNVVLTFDMAGIYFIEIISFPYRDQRFRLVATEP